MGYSRKKPMLLGYPWKNPGEGSSHGRQRYRLHLPLPLRGKAAIPPRGGCLHPLCSQELGLQPHCDSCYILQKKYKALPSRFGTGSSALPHASQSVQEPCVSPGRSRILRLPPPEERRAAMLRREHGAVPVTWISSGTLSSQISSSGVEMKSNRAVNTLQTGRTTDGGFE